MLHVTQVRDCNGALLQELVFMNLVGQLACLLYNGESTRFRDHRINAGGLHPAVLDGCQKHINLLARLRQLPIGMDHHALLGSTSRIPFGSPVALSIWKKSTNTGPPAAAC